VGSLILPTEMPVEISFHHGEEIIDKKFKIFLSLFNNPRRNQKLQFLRTPAEKIHKILKTPAVKNRMEPEKKILLSEKFFLPKNFYKGRFQNQVFFFYV
jgi:hypothetical protein